MNICITIILINERKVFYIVKMTTPWRMKKKTRVRMRSRTTKKEHKQTKKEDDYINVIEIDEKAL